MPVVNMKQIMVFTDLDGTLIDHDTYEFKEAQTALEMLRDRSVPVIICSSKTRAEIDLYRLRMGLNAPFIVENGAAIFVPHNMLNIAEENLVEKGAFHVVELGTPYGILRDIWRKIKDKENLRMTAFSEMTIHEIVDRTGLPFEEARLAAMREYSEPFVFSDTIDRLRLLERLFEKNGLQMTRGGRFYHLIGQNDKGKAVRTLKKLYTQTYPTMKLWTVGLGDSANDIPMLRHVDIPVVIRKKTGQWEHIPAVGPVIYSEKPGPKGWAEAIHRILSEADQYPDS